MQLCKNITLKQNKSTFIDIDILVQPGGQMDDFWSRAKVAVAAGRGTTCYSTST